MGGIFWLASYPKSGNTWFRSFLSNYMSDSDVPVDINRLNVGKIASQRLWIDEVIGFDTSDLTQDEITSLRPDVYRWKHVDDEVSFHKIHDADVEAPARLGKMTGRSPREYRRGRPVLPVSGRLIVTDLSCLSRACRVRTRRTRPSRPDPPAGAENPPDRAHADRRETGNRRTGVAALQMLKRCIIRSKSGPPFRDAMCFVNNEHARVHGVENCQHSLSHQPLGRHVEYFYIAALHLAPFDNVAFTGSTGMDTSDSNAICLKRRRRRRKSRRAVCTGSGF